MLWGDGSPTREFLSHTAEAFVDELVREHAPAAVVEGRDFRFANLIPDSFRNFPKLTERSLLHQEGGQLTTDFLGCLHLHFLRDVIPKSPVVRNHFLDHFQDDLPSAVSVLRLDSLPGDLRG